jgi:hypothetical protein
MLKRFGTVLGLIGSLALTSCANSPFGQSLSRSLAADPQLTEESPTATPEATPQETVSPIETPPDEQPVSQQTPTTPEEDDLANLSPQDFSDLDQAPEELQGYLRDLAELGILTAKSSGDNGLLFAPNDPISRREFARWLVTANNRLYSDRPENRIRLGVTSTDSAFQDVASTSADFPYIQGLAEAGLIPSRLSGSATSTTFRPGAPLTRQDALRWKVPLDVRKPLPTATVDAIQQTWGFQDASQINPDDLKAVLGDYQNGSQANIRRAFGYTTLLQPQKPITRAEAAAMLWYFGFQGDGISAADARQMNPFEAETPSPDSTPETPSSGTSSPAPGQR